MKDWGVRYYDVGLLLGMESRDAESFSNELWLTHELRIVVQGLKQFERRYRS